MTRMAILLVSVAVTGRINHAGQVLLEGAKLNGNCLKTPNVTVEVCAFDLRGPSVNLVFVY